MADSQSSSGPATAPTSQNPATGYTPGDDAWTQWRNIFAILAGKMTDEGKEQFRVARDIRNEAADCKSCEDHRDYLLQYSMASFLLYQTVTIYWLFIKAAPGPVIRFLSDNIRQLGGDLSSHNIYCRRCTKRKAGGFDPEYGILLCANELKDRGHLEDTLSHEMVHAYDHLRFKVDWTADLRHAACTEVKASEEEGILKLKG